MPPRYGSGAPAGCRRSSLPERTFVTSAARAPKVPRAKAFRPSPGTRTRDSLDHIFAGLGQPHTLLRIGYGYPTRLTARRPVEDVLTRRDVPAG